MVQPGPAGPGWTGLSDGDVDRGDLAVAGLDRTLGAHPPGGQDAQRPRTGRGEEPEAAVGAQRDLGHELVTGAEQPRVPGGDRGTLTGDLALHDRLVAGRGGRGDAARGGAAAVRASARRIRSAHRASPSSIGTPTSDPYSVHEPS